MRDFSPLKFISPVIFFLLISFSASWARVDVQQVGNKTIYHFQIDGIDSQTLTLDGEQYVRQRLQGVNGHEGVFWREGMPEVPVVRLLVPSFHPENIKITVSEKKTNTENGVWDFPLVPSQPSTPKIAGAKTKFVKNLNFYKADEEWPQTDFTVEKQGTIRGVPMQLITLFPLHYNPATNEYLLKKNYWVEYTADNQALEQSANKEVFAFVVGKQFVDSPSLKAYMDFKTQLGMHVFTLIVERGDTPEQIRGELQKLLNNREYNLKYVMIVGDAEDVPGRPSTIIQGTTDHFYRCLDTADYATDINGPDVELGRITVKNETELKAVLDKFLRYQKGKFASEEWLSGVSYLATDDRWQVAEGTHNWAIDTYTKKLGYQGVFPNNPQAGGDQLYAITHRVSNETVVATMKLGRTIIDYSGHGATTYWAGPTVQQADVRSMNHPDAVPFVISNACITGQFTIDESFAETWIKHPQGAIMFWGSMDSTYWDEDDVLEKAMFTGIYDRNLMSFGQITNNALTEHYRYWGGANRSNYYWETYHTFGDPSIHLRTAKNQTVVMEGPESAAFGMEEVEYTLLDNNKKPLANVRVALSLKDGDYVYAVYTDAKGKAVLKLSDAPAGSTYLINAYGDNMPLLTKNLSIIGANVPYLLMSQFLVNGQASTEVLPYSKATLGLTIKNAAMVGTQGGKVTLAAIQGPAEITKGIINIPALGADQTYSVNNAFELQIKDGTPGQLITLVFEWETLEGEKGKTQKNLTLARGTVGLVGVDFGDPNNPQVGGISAGQSGPLYLTVKNTGNAPMEKIVLTGAPGECLSQASGELKLDTLAPGKTFRFTQALNVTLSPNCQAGKMAQIKVGGHYAANTQLMLVGQKDFMIGKLSKVEMTENGINLPIPDMNKVTRSIQINAGESPLFGLSVKIDISHTYVGDLIIALIHPNGTRILLRNREGSTEDNINETYGEGGKPIKDLEQILGQAASGEWKLEITDDGMSDVGTLNSYQLALTTLQ
jgi:subtilisin-like proprotein convertase family protein